MGTLEHCKAQNMAIGRHMICYFWMMLRANLLKKLICILFVVELQLIFRARSSNSCI
jgi:hypothetical protein